MSACDTDIKRCDELRALSACSQVVQLARVGVRVLVVDVVCVMLVFIARVVVQAVSTQFSVVGDVLFTPPVGDSELRWLLPNLLL